MEWSICIVENTIYLRTTYWCQEFPRFGQPTLWIQIHAEQLQTNLRNSQKDRKWFLDPQMLLFCIVLGHYHSLHTSTNETPGPVKSAAIPLRAGRSPRQQKRCNVGIGQGDHHPYNQYVSWSKHGMNGIWTIIGDSFEWAKSPTDNGVVKTKRRWINCSYIFRHNFKFFNPHNQK